MTTGHGEAPRLARAVLRLTVPAAHADDVLGTLTELHAARVSARGRLRADAWFWRQAVGFGARLRLARLAGGHPGARRPPTARWLEHLWQDVRFAARGFRRTPGFTLACVGTLGLGIAATTMIYAVARGAALRPPPYPDPDRLVWVWPDGERPLTQERYRELSAAVRPVAELTAFANRAFAVTGGERPDEVSGVAVSPDHFEVFGIPPIRGRGFGPEDGVPGGAPVALLAEELWRSHFGADPDIIGKSVSLFTSASIPMIAGAFTGTPHTVVGILPAGYRPFGFRADVMTPLVADPSEDSFARMGELQVTGRLAPGASRAQLRTRLADVVGRLPSAEEAGRDAVGGNDVVSLHEALTGHVRPAVLLALGAVLLVLLIACANVASLLLARTHARHEELGLRSVLGADRWRIARQVLTESGLLAGAGLLAGVTGATLVLPRVLLLLPSELGLAADSIALDGGVLAFAAGSLLLTTLAAGLGPALGAMRGPADGVAGSRLGAGGDRRRNRTHHALVVGELALAAMLASGAGLLLKSFSRLAHVDPGFEAHGVLTLRVAPSDPRYRAVATRRELYARLLDGIRGLSGVQTAGAIHFLPIADGGPSLNFLPDPADTESRQATAYRVITPGYLETLRIPLLTGRAIAEADDAGSPPVGLVNRALAERLWPGDDPLGRRLFRTNGEVWFTVVGVTSDVRQAALGLPPRPEAYVPLAQSEWASAMTLVVRTSGPPRRLAPRLERLIREADPALPITRTAPMRTLLDRSVASPRFYSLLFAAFAALALALGTLGIYGVVSYVVRQRTDEIGVRIALGASARHIVVNELGRGIRLSALGIALGLAAALASSRVLSGMLFEVSPFDPLVFGAAALILGGAALSAVLIPARRAARVDPMVSIRG